MQYRRMTQDLKTEYTSRNDNTGTTDLGKSRAFSTPKKSSKEFSLPIPGL